MADQDRTPTRVVFRKWPDGGVDAILLDVAATPGHVTCYAHLGQHGEGQYFAVMGQTTPATPAEYADLQRELEAIGYVVYPRKRRMIRTSMKQDYRGYAKRGNRGEPA